MDRATESKVFARIRRSRGLNPQEWAYFGDISALVVNWEDEACRARKEANQERREQWLKWVEVIKNLSKWRASTTFNEFEGGVSGRSSDIVYEERKNWSSV